jgi:hypothetical protein
MSQTPGALYVPHNFPATSDVLTGSYVVDQSNVGEVEQPVLEALR